MQASMAPSMAPCNAGGEGYEALVGTPLSRQGTPDKAMHSPQVPSNHAKTRGHSNSCFRLLFPTLAADVRSNQKGKGKAETGWW